MHYYKVFLLISLLSSVVVAQTASKDRNNAQVPTGIAYYFDFVNMEPADSISTKVDVFIQVPFNKVKFVKSGEVFAGGYTFTVTVMDSTQKVVQEKSWFEKLSVRGFRETMSQKNFNISRKTFTLKPGKYFAKMLMEDQDSRQEFPTTGTFTVRSLTSPLSLSDPVILTASSEQSTAKLPNVSHIVHSKDHTVPFFLQVFAPVDTQMMFEYRVISSDNTTITAKKVKRNLVKGKNQFAENLDSITASTGEYMLHVRVLDTQDKELSSSQRGLAIRLSGLPMIIKDIDKAIDQLVYIAKPSEMDTIKAGKTYEAKLQRFMEFWLTRDRNEATEENEVFAEYYARVDYANKNFGHYIDGWRTDMGMVFIYLGMPNNVERHPFDYDSKPFEVWEYYELNKRFVFVDYNGFGDYRLITPFSGELYRFQ